MGDKKPKQAKSQQVSGSMGGVVEQVSDYTNNTNALGFSFRFFTQEMMTEHRIKLLSIEGVQPSPESIASGEYPLSSSFYAVTRRDNTNTNVDRLLEWLLSEEGQTLIARTGYAPLSHT
jgi:phosphate transport system substrate-binding protein